LERIAAAMEEKLLAADDTLVRSMAPTSVVAT